MTNAEKLQKRPTGALTEAINETLKLAQQVHNPEFPQYSYAYRYFDTGDDEVMLEIYCRGDKKRDNVYLFICDKSGKRLPIGSV